MNKMRIAQQVFENEGNALISISKNITRDFELATDAILNCSGKTIICGMGKSGLIGKKIAATLASTGTPSFYLHPGEAYHGDLGMIGKNDVVVLISYSGETDEVLKLIPFLKSQNNIVISITGKPMSTLAKNSDFHLNVFVESEACPHQLAPTTSTTATLTMGDALAVALMNARDFQPEDFARFHPGGSLGRRLLTKVSDLMISKNLPTVKEDCYFDCVVASISSGKLGLTIILDSNDTVIGIVTDGDLRRAMGKYKTDCFSKSCVELMNNEPIFVTSEIKIMEAEEKMRQYKVSSLIVVDSNKNLLGVVSQYE